MLKPELKKEIFSWIKAVIFAIIFVVVCRQFIFSPTTVLGSSMSPTFEEGNKVFVSKLSVVNRFDMIVFDAPDEDEKYIKRVIGLPGDSIEVKDDELFINNELYKEDYLEVNKKNVPYSKLTGDFTLEELTGESHVPEGYLFVMGDNRLHSKDSRYFGFIPENSLFGKVVFQFYPLNEIGLPK